ncbi:cilia- and flagella-associated protein 97 isoform X3 [Nelusetta ayraudi]|uniref:cilia- and flagella-associated protein 97 isoform X3 n=1 Tax=Nelusetta ayraudi TaxID=303726 RepID=UPI003F6ED036
MPFFSVLPKTAMINPSDQEGEVDHSFFDSDCDDDSISSSTGKISEKGLKAKKETQRACETPQAKLTTISKDGLSQKSIGRRKPSEEGDDTVTDVTALSTPDCSPLQSLDLNHTETEEESVRQQQQHRSVPSSGLSKVHQAKDLGRNVDERFLNSNSQCGAKLVHHWGRARKNYSFSNNEVRNIEHENQRLLRELTRISEGPKPGSAQVKKAYVSVNTPLNKISHHGLNRLREQKRIERENLAFLKRLEAVKPTRGLRRTDQLADYQRLVGYLSGPTTAKKERCATKTPSAQPAQPVSRPSSNTTGFSGITSPAKTKKKGPQRLAWC